MSEHEKVNILMVDDQPAKLLSYEVILRELDENPNQAGSSRKPWSRLLKTNIAVVLMDVSMPELDGFELAGEPSANHHPANYQPDSNYFHLGRAYDGPRPAQGLCTRGGGLFRSRSCQISYGRKSACSPSCTAKPQQLARLNHELEQRVAERTAALRSLHGAAARQRSVVTRHL